MRSSPKSSYPNIPAVLSYKRFVSVKMITGVYNRIVITQYCFINFWFTLHFLVDSLPSSSFYLIIFASIIHEVEIFWKEDTFSPFIEWFAFSGKKNIDLDLIIYNPYGLIALRRKHGSSKSHGHIPVNMESVGPPWQQQSLDTWSILPLIMYNWLKVWPHVSLFRSSQT